MPQGRISTRSVAALSCPPGKDRELLWDNAIAGFGVAAFPSGKKVYLVQFRKDGRSRRAKIGEHGRLTPDQARSEAKKMLGDVEKGADPIAERKRKREIPTVAELADRYLKDGCTTKKPSTRSLYELYFNVHVKPTIGSTKADAVTHGDVARLHRQIGVSSPQDDGDRVQQRRGKAPTANRVVQVISGAFTWAAKEGLLPDNHLNPASKIAKFKETARERFLSTDELIRLGDALREAETIGLSYSVDETKPNAKNAPKPENRRRTLDPFSVAAIRLLLLTGARLREILHAKWSEVDLERGLLLLPTSKTGRKTIYLSAAARSLLAELPRVAGNAYVIPGEQNDAKGGKARADLKRPWKAVTTAAKLKGLRVHDLRHSFASFGAAASLGLPVLGKLLGHSQPSTTQRYAHLAADPLHRAVETISATIDAAMSRKPGADVVPIGKA